jgi:hypothetical protein
MQHQDYDKLFKESFQRLSQVLLQTLLGMDTSSLQPVSTTLPRTIERRADFVAIGTHPITKQQELFHVEFQSLSRRRQIESRYKNYQSTKKQK